MWALRLESVHGNWPGGVQGHHHAGSSLAPGPELGQGCEEAPGADLWVYFSGLPQVYFSVLPLWLRVRLQLWGLFSPSPG